MATKKTTETTSEGIDIPSKTPNYLQELMGDFMGKGRHQPPPRAKYISEKQYNFKAALKKAGLISLENGNAQS